MLLSPPLRRSPPPRRLPSPRRKEAEVRVGARPYVTPERDYTDAAQRYAHLYLSADFAKAVVHWPQVRAARLPRVVRRAAQRLEPGLPHGIRQCLLC